MLVSTQKLSPLSLIQKDYPVLSRILGNLLNRSAPPADTPEAPPVNIANLPKHKQAQITLQRIAAREGRPFNAIKAASVELSVINPNIVALATRINEYAEKLELGQSLVPSDCFSEMKTVSLDEFFTDEEGMYISITAWYDFIKASNRLFTVTESGLSKNKRDVEYSVRLMGKCFTSILNVCNAVETAGQ